MRVEVLYFQAVKKATGLDCESIDLSDGQSLDALIDAVVSLHPHLDALVSSLLLAVNEEHSEGDRTLCDGDSVALMPPFSGG